MNIRLKQKTGIKCFDKSSKSCCNIYKNPNVNWGTVTHYPGQCVAGVIPQLSLINKESKGKIK